jgi:hypothetical protein
MGARKTESEKPLPAQWFKLPAECNLNLKSDDSAQWPAVTCTLTQAEPSGPARGRFAGGLGW